MVRWLLPKGKFSRNDPCRARVTFFLDWDFNKFYREQQYDILIEEVLERAVTFTGYGNKVQICTCLEYMSQTWPRISRELLGFLQRVFKNPSNPKEGDAGPAFLSDELPGETLIFAALGHKAGHGVMVGFVGSTFAISEIAEQLAWLGAALRSAPKENGPMSCTPYVHLESEYQNKVEEFGQTIVAKEHIFRIVFHLAQFPAHFSGQQGSCWRALGRSPVIVGGYPIPRNQTPASGAQIPLDIAGALINSKRLVKWGGTIFIKGFSALLAVTKVVGEIVLWHLVHNEDGSYMSYADPRVPRWSESADPFLLESMGQYRHVVGWCDKIISNAGMFLNRVTTLQHHTNTNLGARNANYAVGWSGLPNPDQNCALEKVTISCGQFINVGLSCALGIKDKALSINFGDDYYGVLDNIADHHFVLFDPDSSDRRGWLLDGASTLLHLLRASIKNYKEGRLRKILCSPDNIELDDGTNNDSLPTPGSRTAAAFEILSNADNLSIPLYPLRTKVRQVQTATLGARAESSVREETSFFTIRDRMDQLCEVLCQITAHYDDVQTQTAAGFRLRSTPRRQLEGFDFKDIATGQSPLRPKVATLRTKGLGWVDFTRALHAPTLFGRGFGEVLAPYPHPPIGSIMTGTRANHHIQTRADSLSRTCTNCHWNTPLPTRQDLLAATTSDMNAILRRYGNRRLTPWRLVDTIHWYTPSLTFGPCTTTPSASPLPAPGPSSASGSSSTSASSSSGTQKCNRERIQTLLPSSFPKLWGKASPRSLAADGAVMFGHSARFPLRFGQKRGSAPEVGEVVGEEVMDDTTGGFDRLFVDSGIGSSLGPSTESRGSSGGSSPGEGERALSRSWLGKGGSGAAGGGFRSVSDGKPPVYQPRHGRRWVSETAEG